MSLTDENESTIISHTKKLISTQDEKKLMGLYSYYNEYNLQDELERFREKITAKYGDGII
jgi:hypothetical protein